MTCSAVQPSAFLESARSCFSFPLQTQERWVIQLKILHRAYITPSRLKKMDNTLSNMCWHGCGEVGTLVHSLWLCPAVKVLWDVVRDTPSKILNIDVTLSLATCLLGVQPTGINSVAHKIVAFACLTTKRMILMNRKGRRPGCFNFK